MTSLHHPVDLTAMPDPLIWDGLENDMLAWLSDPDDPRFQAAMKRRCEVCGASKGRPCWNTIDSEAPLPNRLIHIGRTEITGIPKTKTHDCQPIPRR